jgi:hypothetical protein
LREHIHHELRWLSDRLKQKTFAIERYSDADRMRGTKSFGRAHSRFLQPGVCCGGAGEGMGAIGGIGPLEASRASPLPRWSLPA